MFAQKCAIIYQVTVFSAVILFITVMLLGVITTFTRQHGIITRSKKCMDVGKSILKNSGSAVDVGIAILACECVASPDKTGFGGGFVAIIYEHKTKSVKTLIATETATAASLFDLERSDQIVNVGVPGLVKGMWELFKTYKGALNWKTLMKGAYDLATEYSKNNKDHLKKFQEHKELILSKELLKTVTILRDEPHQFYSRSNGSLAGILVDDIKQMGGNLELDELSGYNPDKTGFGGGFVAIIYEHKTKSVKTLIATETATAAASFNLERSDQIVNVGVPGLVKGMWELFKTYKGALNWKTLMKGAYDLATEYSKNNKDHLKKFQEHKELILSKELLKTVTILRDEPHQFYSRSNGSLAGILVDDIKQMGGNLELDELSGYNVKWAPPFESTIEENFDYILYTTPPPTAGILSAIYIKLTKSILTGFDDILKELTENLSRLLGSFKIVLAQWKFFGDSEFAPESKKLYEYMEEERFIRRLKKQAFTYRSSEMEYDNIGLEKVDEKMTKSIIKGCSTSPFSFSSYVSNYRLSLCDFVDYKHQDSMDIIVFKNNYDSIIISTSLTSNFGSKRVSSRTGIILNNHLSLFSSRPESPNVIAQSKRPLNWYTPGIIMDKSTNRPKMLLSAAGAGMNNIQIMNSIVYNFFMIENLPNVPSIHHLVNSLRFVFDLTQQDIIENNKTIMTVQTVSPDPVILTETPYINDVYARALNQSDSFLSRNYKFKVANTSKFSSVSLMLLGDAPEPNIYSDARTQNAYEWIFGDEWGMFG